MSDNYLLLRRDGCLWAVPSSAVTTIARHRGAVRVLCGEARLVADDVLGLRDDVRLRPAGGLAVRWWPHRCLGFGVAGQTPVVAVDPAEPPPSLRDREGDELHGD